MTGYLVEMLGPEKILWGSDWPFTQHADKVEGEKAMDKYRNIFSTYKIWSKGGSLFDSDTAFSRLLDRSVVMH